MYRAWCGHAWHVCLGSHSHSPSKANVYHKDVPRSRQFESSCQPKYCESHTPHFPNLLTRLPKRMQPSCWPHTHAVATTVWSQALHRIHHRSRHIPTGGRCTGKAGQAYFLPARIHVCQQQPWEQVDTAPHCTTRRSRARLSQPAAVHRYRPIITGRARAPRDPGCGRSP
jgi:hypothetical protein